MSKEKVGLSDILGGAKDFVTAMAPGLTAEKIGSDLFKEVKQQTEHGSHEISALLFTGSSFVMYPRGSHDDQGKEVEGPEAPAATPEVENDRER